MDEVKAFERTDDGRWYAGFSDKIRAADNCFTFHVESGFVECIEVVADAECCAEVVAFFHGSLNVLYPKQGVLLADLPDGRIDVKKEFHRDISTTIVVRSVTSGMIVLTLVASRVGRSS